MTESTFQISLIRETHEFHALKPEWNDLLTRSSADSVYLTWEYVSTWWKIYGTNYQLRIVTARDITGTLIGIAPMIVGKGEKCPHNLLRCLSFIGTLGDTSAEYLDFIIAPGLESKLTARFIRYFQNEMALQWDLLTLRQVPRTAKNLAYLLQALPEDHGVTLHIDSTPSPYVPLPESWDRFLASKSKNFQKAYKGHRNRFHKKHQVRELIADRDLSLEAAMKMLMELNQDRWGSAGSTFKSSEFFNHHLEIAKIFSERGWLYFRLLEADGNIVSARFDFIYNHKLWNILGGWDQAFSKYSLGRLAIGREVEWCIEQGIQEYDFLGGDSSYKRTWSTEERYLIDLVAGNPSSLRATALDQLRSLRDFVRPRRLRQISSTDIPLPS